MPKEKAEKSLCLSGLRHAEYYGIQEVFDGLYAKSSKNETFTNLMNIILKRENILLAYRNIKSNDGSKTPGTDGVTFDDIGKLMPDEVIDTVRFITIGSTHGYRPKPVRRKEIPKPYDPTKTRPLGIPCVWDRLVQQCIKQVMEPICEAKFSENSYGFRPNRSAENAIARAEFLIQNTRLHYVVEFDVKGFFDNVDHSKLIKQIWSLGIRDKNLLFVLKRILKAPIRLENGAMEYPTKGTPQGGIISPLLANIVLNELDQWVDSQWQDNPVTAKYKTSINANGSINKSNAYKFMRRTNLFSAQYGKCAVTGMPFLTTDEMHCHHIKPKKYGGNDSYENLVLINKLVHRLVHAETVETITYYLEVCNLNKKQMEKLNALRLKAGLGEIRGMQPLKTNKVDCNRL